MNGTERTGFLLYVPNATLTAFHDRSPWILLPQAFAELGFNSSLICGVFKTVEPKGVRVVKSGLGADKGARIPLGRSLIEPVLVLRSDWFRSSDIIVVGPMRSSLASLVPLLFLERLFDLRGRRTRCVLKTDWTVDHFGLGPVRRLLADTLLVISSYAFDLVSFETSCGLSRARRLPLIRTNRLTYLPIASPQRDEEITTYDQVRREPLILCVARISRPKGQDVLLRAFSLLRERFPRWNLRLVGPVDDPVFLKELHEFVSSNSLSECVEFAGFIDHEAMREQYRRAAIFCLPSVSMENAGQVRHEATGYGLPVVTTDVPSQEDASRWGWCVTRAKDPSDLAARLAELMDDEARRRSVANRSLSLRTTYRDVAVSLLSQLGDHVKERVARQAASQFHSGRSLTRPKQP